MGTSRICCINRLQSQIEFEHPLFVERNQWINSSSAASSTTESNLSYFNKWSWPAIQFTSFTQSCLTLCNPMNRSTPGLPVHHQLSELTQTHVHWVGDTIQSSHPLSSPSPSSFNLSQHQGLVSQPFTSGGQSVEASASASVLPINIQDWFPLILTGWIS